MPDLALEQTLLKVRYISDANVDCIVDICPFCHLQLDLGQTEINRKFKESFEIPVLHLSQFLGLAFGFPPTLLGLEANATPTKAVLEKV